MDVCCSFKSLVGGQCLAFDRRDRKQSMDIAPLLSCTKNITQHKSSIWSSHTVSRPRKDLWHVDSSNSRPLLSLAPFFPRLPAFFNRPQLPRQSPHFFPRPPFFARSQLPREFPLFFLARPPFSLAPNYRESLPFFSSLARFTERVPNFFSSLARFFRPLPTAERVPPFFLALPIFSSAPNYRESSPLFSSLARLFRSPQLPRAWNRLSENLQRSCLFSTQCLRIEKSVLLEFDRDQYYVLPK